MQSDLIRCPFSKKNNENQKKIVESVSTVSNILTRTTEQTQLQLVSLINSNYFYLIIYI
jgi:hypothetical protein